MFETVRKRRVKIRHYDYKLRQTDAKENKLPQEQWGWREIFGWFSGYGLDYHETEQGVASYTVAIVEDDEDGIKLVHPSNVTFIP